MCQDEVQACAGARLHAKNKAHPSNAHHLSHALRYPSGADCTLQHDLEALFAARAEKEEEMLALGLPNHAGGAPIDPERDGAINGRE